MEQNSLVYYPIGFSELHEWISRPDGWNKNKNIFVQFSDIEPSKIEPFDGAGVYAGIAGYHGGSVASSMPDWPGRYKLSETLEYIPKEHLFSVGNKEYDQLEELPFIHTFAYKTVKKTETGDFKEDQRYIPREVRLEWIPVNYIGKTVLEDDGNCIEGKFASPYVGNDYSLAGIAVPSDSSDAYTGIKVYVMKRLSDHTILVCNNPVYNK